MGLIGLKLEKMDMLGNAIKDLKDISIDNYLLNTYYQQSSSGQRGVGWGQWEEGITGTTIKDTNKIKREGGGGGGRRCQLGWGGGMGRKGIQL